MEHICCLHSHSLLMFLCLVAQNSHFAHFSARIIKMKTFLWWKKLLAAARCSVMLNNYRYFSNFNFNCFSLSLLLLAVCRDVGKYHKEKCEILTPTSGRFLCVSLNSRCIIIFHPIFPLALPFHERRRQSCGTEIPHIKEKNQNVKNSHNSSRLSRSIRLIIMSSQSSRKTAEPANGWIERPLCQLDCWFAQIFAEEFSSLERSDGSNSVWCGAQQKLTDWCALFLGKYLWNLYFISLEAWLAAIYIASMLFYDGISLANNKIRSSRRFKVYWPFSSPQRIQFIACNRHIHQAQQQLSSVK